MTFTKNNGIKLRPWARTITTAVFLFGVVYSANVHCMIMMNIVSEGLKEIPLNLDKYNEYVSRRFPELHLDNESLRLENGLLRLQIDQLRGQLVRRVLSRLSKAW